MGRKLSLMAGDAAVFAAAVSLLLSMREPYWIDPALARPFVPLLGFTIATAYAAGLYELRLIRDFVALIGGLLISGIACGVFAMTYFYLLSSYVGFAPKATLLFIVFAAHAGMLLWRRGVLAATGFGLLDLRILILGDERYSDYLRASEGRRANEDFNLVTRGAGDVDMVVVDRRWTDRHPAEARSVLAEAIANRVPVVSINEFHEALFGKVSPQHANDLAWALDHVLPRSGSLYFTSKRVFDVAASAVLLVLLAPIIFVIAAAIMLLGGGSPLYAQTRVGYLGKSFRLWKFRTMHQGAEGKGPFSPIGAGRDRRITRIGGVLRRLRLDELPQLWNVLRGDMSLVGPRPEWVEEVAILEKAVPTYSLRYLVPPGITGWAQVYFRATNNPQDAIEKHNYDLYYLKHFSLTLDFTILLKTIKRAFVKDSRISTMPAFKPFDLTSDSDVRLDVASIVDRS